MQKIFRYFEETNEMLQFYLNHNGKIRSLVTFSFIGFAVFYFEYFVLESLLFLAFRYLLEHFFISEAKKEIKNGNLHIFYTGKTRFLQIGIGCLLTATIAGFTLYFNWNLFKAEMIFMIMLLNRTIELFNPFATWSTMVYNKKIYKNNYLLIPYQFACCAKLKEINYNTFEISDENQKIRIQFNKKQF